MKQVAHLMKCWAKEKENLNDADQWRTRALLADTLWPKKFSGLINEELRFGIVMTWLYEKLKAGADRFKLLDELGGGRPKKGSEIPEAIRQTAAWLRGADCPIPNYVTDALMFLTPDQPGTLLFEPALNTFLNLWTSQLRGLSAEKISVLEIACGSGNEYRALDEFGLAAHINYSGFDIASKNIANATKNFPGVKFFEASILNSGLPDNSTDYIFLHDVLGHLSLEAMEIALKEIMRIVRKEAWLHCFNAADIPEHVNHPVELYHRNRLSISRLTESLRAAGAADVEAIPISAMLQNKFHFTQDYTASAVTFIVRKQP